MIDRLRIQQISLNYENKNKTKNILVITMVIGIETIITKNKNNNKKNDNNNKRNTNLAAKRKNYFNSV